MKGRTLIIPTGKHTKLHLELRKAFIMPSLSKATVRSLQGAQNSEELKSCHELFLCYTGPLGTFPTALHATKGLYSD